jgi:hypothetical protein
MRAPAIDIFGLARIGAAICLTVPCASIAVAQADRAPDATHHLIVPLTSSIGVVSGDPSKPGAPFVLRIANRANQIVPVHWHPEDENITVVQGTWYLGSGDKFDRKALHEMNVGDYALMPKKMRHFGWSKTDTIIQVHGIGPFQIIPYGTWEMSSGWTQTEQGMVKDERVALSFKFKSTDRVQSKRGLGTILGAFRSLNDGVTQYEIATENGTKVYEFEEDLSLVARTTRQSGVFAGKWACVSSDMPGFVGLPDNKLESIMRLDQDGTKVWGTVESAGGGSQISFLVPDENSVEFVMDTSAGRVAFHAKHQKGELAGRWRLAGFGEGAWNCKHVAGD